MRFFGKKQNPEHAGAIRAKGFSGFGAPLHYSFGERELPSVGASNYAFETMALPKYSPIGPGVHNRDAWAYDQLVRNTVQGVNLSAIGSPGVLTGGLYAAPLTDTQGNNLPPEVQAALMAAGSFPYAIPRP